MNANKDTILLSKLMEMKNDLTKWESDNTVIDAIFELDDNKRFNENNGLKEKNM